MADFFNSEGAYGRTAGEIEQISILQRRYNFIEAYEDYLKKKYNNIGTSLNLVRARLISLFLQIQATTERRLEEYTSIEKSIFIIKEENDIKEMFYIISRLLDKLKITRLDVYEARSKRVMSEKLKRSF